MSLALEVLGPACLVLTMYAALSAWADRRRRWVRRGVIAVGLLSCYRYFYWRLGALPPAGEAAAHVAGIGALALELSSSLLWQYHYIRSAAGYIHRGEIATRQAGWYGRAAPRVDVLIPSYNESIHVLERTLAAATAMEYPNFRVWLLDDGGRDSVEKFCRQRGVGYLRRQTHDGYKAGNLNHALAALKRQAEPAEFIAVFDADFIPRAAFLQRTMALMADPAVALVQTPQHFANPDPIQYAFKAAREWPDDLRFVFSVLMVGWDAAGSTSCCGTSFLVRSEVIERIGGFPTDSVTEDLLTACRLHAVGAKCVYLNETASVGLAADGLVDHLNQRARWVFGAAQVARGPWGPLRRRQWPGSWLAFCDLGVRPGWMAMARQLLAWGTVASLLTGVPLVRATVPEALGYLAPLAIARCMYAWMTGGALLPIISDVNHVICDLAVFRANVAGLLRPERGVFKVTDKGAQRDRVHVHGKLLAYFGGVSLLTLVGIGRVQLATDPWTTELGFHLLWGCYQLVVFGLACVPCIERPKYRSCERYPGGAERVGVASRHGTSEARLCDICPDGVALAGVAIEPGERVTLSLADVGDIDGTVIRCAANGTRAVRFAADAPQRLALIRKIYSGDRYVSPPLQWSVASIMQRLVSRSARSLSAAGAASVERPQAAARDAARATSGAGRAAG